MSPMFFEIAYVLILLIGILVVLKSHQLTNIVFTTDYYSIFYR